MKTIVIVRHGNNTENGHLSSQGEVQIKYLAGLLRKTIKTKSIILTSTAPRAMESSKILGSSLKTIIEPYEFLYRGVELEKVTNLIKSKTEKVDHIIIVTHSQYIGLFCNHIGKAFFKVNFPEQETLNNGQALVINCKTKKIKLVG